MELDLLSEAYARLRGRYQCVTHPFATNFTRYCYHKKFVRLACLRHAASVHPEPGSNSQLNIPSSEDDETSAVCLPGVRRTLWNTRRVIASRYAAGPASASRRTARRGRCNHTTYKLFDCNDPFGDILRRGTGGRSLQMWGDCSIGEKSCQQGGGMANNQ